MIHYYTRTKMKAQLAFKKRKEKEKKKRGEKKRVCLTLCPMTERKGGSGGRTEVTIADGEITRL